MPSPAAAPVVTSLVRMTVATKTNGQLCENTFDYSNTSGTPIGGNALLTFIADWQTALQSFYLACLSPLTTLFSYTAAELHFGLTASQVFLLAPGVIGTAGATNLSLEMAATMLRYTLLKGKHGRGRIAMPAVPNTFVTPATDSNVLNATGLAAYGSLGTHLTLNIISGGDTFTPMISTRPIPPAVLVNNAGAIQKYIVPATLGTNRRRKPGRGI